jgi:hypothetical protein
VRARVRRGGEGPRHGGAEAGPGAGRRAAGISEHGARRLGRGRDRTTVRADPRPLGTTKTVRGVAFVL